MAELNYPKVLVGIIERHFEEFDLLWERREGALDSADWDQAELAELEARAFANLEGLIVGEGHAVDLARPALEGDEASAATAAAFVFAGYPAAEARAELMSELVGIMRDGESIEVRDGIRIGLRHAKIDCIQEELATLAVGEDLGVALAAADVLAFHGVRVPELERLLAVEEAESRVLVCGALGRSGQLTEADRLRSILDDEEREVQLAAWRAAAMSSLTGLEELCRELASGSEPATSSAIEFLGVFGSAADLPLLKRCARAEAHASAAITALGALGRTAAVPTLIELMRGEPALAREAAAAFTRITGIAQDQFEGERPEAPPIDGDDLDAEFDDDSPVPDADKAASLAESSCNGLDPAIRWQQGRDVATLEEEPGGLTLQVLRDLRLARTLRGSE